MKKLFDLKGKVIVITGAGGVLCGTFAKALAEVGRRWLSGIWLKGSG